MIKAQTELVPTNRGVVMEKTDFIEVYDGALSKEYCEELISFIDGQERDGLLVTRFEDGDLKMHRDDSYCILSKVRHDLCSEFFEVFWGDVYNQYVSKYNILASFNKHTIYGVKAQKTKPSEGYHEWHCEKSAKLNSSRIMAYTVYLNDDYEAGETEFLYQQKRIKGQQGSVCIFPAGYTHVHRGNPPIGGNKYILTGWVEFE